MRVGWHVRTGSRVALVVAVALACTGCLPAHGWGHLPSPPGDTWVKALGVGPTGEILGEAGLNDSQLEAAEWDTASRTATTLASPTGFTVVSAVAANTGGVIVGDAEEGPAFAAEAVEWTTPGAAPIALTGPITGAATNATGINASGTVVGYQFNWDYTPMPPSWSPDVEQMALIWDASTHLPTVLAAPSGYTETSALGINDSGTVVGWGLDTSNHLHGIEWDAATHTPTVLASLPGNPSATAVGVTASGEIVGNASGDVPVVWEAAADTPTALTSGYQVVAVNSVGLILGAGADSTGAPGTAVIEWAPTTHTATPITPPTGWTVVTPTGLSDNGVISAYGTESSQPAQPLQYLP